MIILALCFAFLFTGVMLILPVALTLLSVAVPVILTVMLVLNAVFLAVLLVARHLWKRSGRMDRGYIDGLSGWKQVCLRILKYVLLILIVWEALMVLGCALLLIFKPYESMLLGFVFI